jgi:hypothetical protein
MTRSRVNADNSRSNTRSFAGTTEPSGFVDGSIWVDTDGIAAAIQRLRWKKTPSAGTAALTGLNDEGNQPLVYATNYEEVFLNGVLLVRGVDYSATDGTTVTLAEATVAGDIVEIFTTPNLAVTDVYTTGQADAKYLPKSLVDAKGDLYVATTDNTTVRLPVGGNDQVLVADSTTTNGVAWKSNVKQGFNRVLNSDMSIWQRGLTFTGGNAFAADRWRPDSAATIARGTGPGFITYCMDITGSVGNPAIRQSLELPGAGAPGPYQSGTTWTLSLYAKTSTTVSAQLTFYAAFLDALAAGAGNVVTVAGGISMGSVTTSWARYSVTFTIPSTPAGTNRALTIVPYLNSGSYAGTFSITGIQLEPGSTATPFQTTTGDYATDLLACQRHYFRTTPSSSFGWLGSGMGNSATIAAIGVPLPVAMRATPTAVEFANIALSDSTGSITVTGCTLDTGVSSNYFGVVNTTATGLTQYRPYYLRQNANSAGYIGFTADL